jgi:hypothetical protein
MNAAFTERAPGREGTNHDEQYLRKNFNKSSHTLIFPISGRKNKGIAAGVEFGLKRAP